MSLFLGMEVVQSPGRIEITQRSYVLDVLRRFGMAECNPSSLPADPGVKFSKSDCPAEHSPESFKMAEYHSLYRSSVGGLQYLSVVPRPDISFLVSNLSQFLGNPGKVHWLAAKRVLRYLKGSREARLVYSSNEFSFSVAGYSDSD